MAEGTEVEERVDLDEENYMEEMDDDAEEQIDEDVEEQLDDDGVDGGEYENVEENVEEVHEDSVIEPSGKDQSPEADRSHIASESIEDEQKPAASVDNDEKEKHAELLALPPHGSEVFIGGLPRDAQEEDLRNLCEPIGEIIEVRLMKDKETGDAKGYAFIAFKTKEVAQKAIEEIHNKDFKGKNLRCSLSETKHRLFIGNVPKSLTEDEFKKFIEEAGPGVENIELIRDPQNPSRNRGFAFVLYYNNACADYSRQKMLSSNFKLDGNTPTVTWADPKSAPDHSAASQVKALYVKNIPENTSTEKMKELFQRHGEVTKVVMPPGKAGGKRDFGFIHYAERSSALKAVKDTEKYEIDGQFLEVVLAKPQTDKKFDGAYPYNAAPHPNHLPHSGYGGFAGNQYGSVGAGYGVAPGFQQPMIYGRGPMPAGMHMVPMVLPDGRIGYVLQQPGVQIPPPRPRRIDRNNPSSGPPARAGGSGSDEGNRGRRYRPY
ncbi:heterogeneous nuclear ribonucleoprotein Q [Carya illinoinensis]|uniref:RRM domain-containing protein n=1 Tax=Carya illinoinensis TaxID=32201 RepID=A0A8T1RBH9_CARIL|nr:heterogeneous nuclear ribonucleoprotein Q [Carya illinoinensis]XP_042966393.1 heterogeneous nuclear ribonucleoprotein Q [Carya illinoinensis]XP_042966394.1 heterogeneous nuclear ribonucleoprotein Q [Carya illinoinensis]XP_042966395.1 heterogeneous nuclear ribonucleoprotein Q [Carya illinoinensis]XP_042966396.1 heterogeneous nuclear ribonucleoprotein Q [Carya illinoinensis]XP_042966397.1 heterogeneous nuclear ribonucleoprotein Q [Carya illinoinensis]XP_042966398.1 heterogeneous nuclear ribo